MAVLLPLAAETRPRPCPQVQDVPDAIGPSRPGVRKARIEDEICRDFVNDAHLREGGGAVQSRPRFETLASQYFSVPPEHNRHHEPILRAICRPGVLRILFRRLLGAVSTRGSALTVL